MNNYRRAYQRRLYIDRCPLRISGVRVTLVDDRFILQIDLQYAVLTKCAKVQTILRP